MCNADAVQHRCVQTPRKYRRPVDSAAPHGAEHPITAAHPLTLYEHTQHKVTAITYVPHHELVVIASKDFRIAVYDASADSAVIHATDEEATAAPGQAALPEPLTVFQEHQHVIFEVVHLSDDVIASADAGGYLKTWHATTGDIVHQIHIPNVGWLYTICHLDPSRLAIGTRSGALVVVTRDDDEQLTIDNVIERTPMDWINSASASASASGSAGASFSASGNTTANSTTTATPRLLVTTSPGRTATVWDIANSTPVPVSLLHHNRYVSCVTVNEQQHRILVGCDSGEIYIYTFQLRPKLLHLVKPHSQSQRHRKIIPLNRDTLLILSSSRYISLLSIHQNAYTAQIKISKANWPTTLQIAPSGNLILGGIAGYAAVVQAPKSVG